MKAWQILFTILFLSVSSATFAQKVALPHGMVFGSKADTANAVDANNLRRYMGEKKRITTIIKGTVERVTEEKGGWFVLQTKGGEPIYAHFRDYNVTLPKQIKGRVVIVSAVAKREFTADDHQHFAGDTVTYSTTSKMSKAITLEVKGLMIYK
ncbi:DUF4920 domain-containing protein [Mucilaginibacter sp. UR6-1]|uniref:DUF4920 domain-containing protein n=1 Tax=Mucilaginibacter sp. UR6-1 TaxID=1435643 RepID=UPI001E4698EF|nr:DUF4920 domain-containing protein [Mucilaginibacter sp. UR6-1]MCC8410553.1 DUF4920 domain-containing protein [Mucilaginibacter sp. UR6-1]